MSAPEISSSWGWLRPYLCRLDYFTGRWDYWLRTLEAGEVLDEPIPQIQWSRGHDDARKNLASCLKHCTHYFADEAFNLFVQWLLYGFGDPSIKERDARITPEMNAAWYQTFNLGLYLQHPADYLGEYAAEIYGSRRHNPTGFFPTPIHVCVLMAAMTMREAVKTSSVCDPCVGTGRLLMVASNYSLNLYGMDIDLSILRVCKINMWLYVPWVIAPLPSFAQPQQGNSLVPPLQQVTPEVQQQLLGKAKQLDLFS